MNNWWNKTWNPVIGCSKVSEGCKNCYAEKMAERLAYMGNCNYVEVVNNISPLTEKDEDYCPLYSGWSGKTYFVESALDKPLRWKKPRKIFICSMGDIFHESVPFEWVDRVIKIIARCPQHTFQVLTKRPWRMKEYFCRLRDDLDQARRLSKRGKSAAGSVSSIRYREGKYLINLWLGVTVENQKAADERIPFLLETPAAMRFVSVEPMLERVDIMEHLCCKRCGYTRADSLIHWDHELCDKNFYPAAIDWVICGGETGPGARPINSDWALDLYAQCSRIDVPFFFKKWGSGNESKINLAKVDNMFYDREFPK